LCLYAFLLNQIAEAKKAVASCTFSFYGHDPRVMCGWKSSGLEWIASQMPAVIGSGGTALTHGLMLLLKRQCTSYGNILDTVKLLRELESHHLTRMQVAYYGTAEIYFSGTRLKRKSVAKKAGTIAAHFRRGQSERPAPTTDRPVQPLNASVAGTHTPGFKALRRILLEFCEQARDGQFLWREQNVIFSMLQVRNTCLCIVIDKR
jgi:hypothetical protein